MNTLSELICSAKQIKTIPGNLTGKCAFCGKSNNQMNPLKLKDTFTSNEYIQDTGLICSPCMELYSNPEYRNNIWICYVDEFRIIKREEVIKEILNVKSYPYAIYTTQTYKKQGWITILTKLNYSPNLIIIPCDLLLLMFNREEFISLHNKVKSFFDLGLKKIELTSGQIIKKNTDSLKNFREILIELEKLHNNPKWEWMVSFTPYPEEKKK